IDMLHVTFIRPYAVIALVTTARQHHTRTGQPLTLTNTPLRVHQYLERVDLFRHLGDIIRTETTLTELFDRDQPNPKLLELTPITGTNDMLRVITAAERIFAFWLHVRNLRRLMSVLSEICANAYQHSGSSTGVVMIQTHEATSKDQVRVRVAIGDVGIGVRGSLSARFGEIEPNTLGYLQQAMNGRTSRHTGRGGLGLRVVQQTVGEGGGYLWLRSEDAAVLSDGVGANTGYEDLAMVPGTQLSVDFHAPLR
ncbi:MAG: ATP-binding protein, partial [Chloroflexota bacterium]